ncbi:MAG: hypothetical protein K6B52_07230 [Clostridiales bacterium]|nr:hypothetical protein [Clostridiales bacterium]
MRTFSFPRRPGFSLRVADNRLDFFAENWQLFSFPVSSRVVVQGADEQDLDESLSLVSERQKGACTELIWQAKSHAWEKKEYIVCVFDDHVTYEIHMQGAGAPERIDYFRGAKTGGAAHYFVAGCLHCQAEDMDYERERRFVGTDLFLYPGMASPPPFVFPFFNDANDARIAVGVAAPKGENTYSRINIRYIKPQTMWLELPYDAGALAPESRTSPTVWFGFGNEDFAIVRNYADWCRERFDYPAAPNPAAGPEWWNKPIFCGWLEQDFLAGHGEKAKEYATQQAYEEMTRRIDRVGLRPGVIIIDDKWQKDYGTMEPDTEKWPDMRAFTDAQHAAGRHVLLWWRLWAPDGLSGDECIQDSGVNVAADPTSSAYLARLQKIIHRLLSDAPGCMNCDGFKLDYIYRLPKPEVKGHAAEAGVAGMELMRRYYKAIYDLAKKEKADALINTSVAHPYFGDVFDQIRLHDYNSAQRSTVSIMRFRAAFVRAVFPGARIDTDGANFFTGNSQHILYHNRAAVEIGCPSLYGLIPLTDDELSEIQTVWDEYEKKNR